jgi:hypothetical protein
MIALSSTKSEYISLSSATRKIIPVMGLLQEMIALNFDVGAGVGAGPLRWESDSCLT